MSRPVSRLHALRSTRHAECSALGVMFEGVMLLLTGNNPDSMMETIDSIHHWMAC